MGTLTNSEDPDEMPHLAAFHQGLHCLLRQIDLLRKKYNICLEIISCDPSLYTIKPSPKGSSVVECLAQD